ncbi:hypothetical protein PRK78_006788 [Emydomyces testavorans]|uniref:Uncharacterized protein n=1 Tax=Emydomyces testavorans TaxID=2070801 RepID=A0AAF0DN59_9EURO|nr:hypothetical protein PRK78_006788 [Emydomyces testavorans]
MVFLCTWVVIHPRVYNHERYATLHKFALLCKALLAPEFIAVEGLQEWAQCQRMKRDCARLTEGQFKPIHAFYISMLALRYRTPKGDRVIWPNQYTWLLQQRLIDWEDHASWGLSVEHIRDKSKADSVARLLALMQVCWFVAQCIMRAAHALPISQLESMALSYIPLFVVTYFFWWNKPKDIRSPSIVELPDMSTEQRHIFESMAVSNKFDNEGLKDQVTYCNVWYLTPRVFEKEEEDRAIQEAQATASAEVAQGAAARSAKSLKENSKPGTLCEITVSEGEIPNPEIVVAHWDPHLYRSKIWPLTCLFGVSFGALHLISWNSVFPTTVEMWLWRVSAFVSILSMLVFMHFEKVVLRWDGLLTIISLASPGLYFLSRILMIGEVFAALRAEEPSIYDTYVVSSYWVHLL